MDAFIPENNIEKYGTQTSFISSHSLEYSLKMAYVCIQSERMLCNM